VERKIDNNIINRAKLLYYVSSLRPAANIHYAGSASEYLFNTLSDSKISVGSDYGIDSCDLIVQADPDEQSLRKAYSALQPGAYIYTEWSAALYSRADQFINTLRSIGLEEINIYLPKPYPSDSLPRIYIPLEVPGAIEFLIDTSYQTLSTNIFKKAAYSFRKLLWRITPKLFLTYPWLLSSNLYKFSLCSIARKPLNKPSYKKTSKQKIYTQINLVDKLKEGWENWGLGERPYKLSTLVFDKGRINYAKLIIFVFVGSDINPTLVIKLPQSREAENGNSNEEKFLRILNKKYKRIERIPNSVLSEQSLGRHVVCQTYLSGIPLNNIINSKNYRELALSTTYWLIQFAKETKSEPPNDWFNIYIKQVISCFRQGHLAV